MLESMRQNLEIVAANRRELNGEIQPEEMVDRQEQTSSDDDFEFDENSFLEGVDTEE